MCWFVLLSPMQCVWCRLPVDQRRGYTSVFNALSRITREEGVLTLWRVCTQPFCQTACLALPVFILQLCLSDIDLVANLAFRIVDTYKDTQFVLKGCTSFYVVCKQFCWLCSFYALLTTLYTAVQHVAVVTSSCVCV